MSRAKRYCIAAICAVIVSFFIAGANPAFGQQLYWSQVGDLSVVGHVGLDGSNPVEFVVNDQPNIIKAYGMETVESTGFIYWSQAKNQSTYRIIRSNADFTHPISLTNDLVGSTTGFSVASLNLAADPSADML